MSLFYTLTATYLKEGSVCSLTVAYFEEGGWCSVCSVTDAYFKDRGWGSVCSVTVAYFEEGGWGSVCSVTVVFCYFCFSFLTRFCLKRDAQN